MTSQRDELDRSIESLRQALAAAAIDDPELPRLLTLLADALLTRFDSTGDPEDVDAAIGYLERALAATPAEDPQRPARSAKLARARDLAADRGTAEPASGASGGHVPVQWDSAEFERGVADDDYGRYDAAPPSGAGLPDPGSLPDVGGRPAVQPAPPTPPQPGFGAPAGFPDLTPGGVLGGPAGPPRSAAPPLPPAPAPRAEPAPERAARPRTAPAGPAKAAPAREAAVSDGRLEFAAAYRAEVERERSYPFLFFVHRPHDRARVQEIIERRAPQLGGAPAVSQGAAARDVRSGTTVTIVPSVLGATFSPERVELVAGDDLRELTFQVNVPATTGTGRLDGYVDIFVGPLVIGQVPVAFEVRAPEAVSVDPRPGEAELLRVANASVFDTIFISYSHKDAAVVDLSVSTYEGLGVRVLVDRHELRAGDAWRPRLESLIRDASIFQLYWSSASATSSEVAHEWELALELAKLRDRFIRPLYWETPLPATPEELGHLHFSKLDLKALRRAAKAYLPKAGLLRRLLTSLR